MHLHAAIKLAKDALNDGDGPFGAIIAKGPEILATARNRTVAEGNPTMHAEMVAIREACKEHGSETLKTSTIYCSCEPCLMCLSAIYYSQIPRLVFAASLEDAIHFGSGDPLVRSEWLNKAGNLNIEIIQGEGRESVISLFDQYVKKFGKL